MFHIPEELMKPEEPYTGELRDYFVSYSHVGDLQREPDFKNTIVSAPYPVTHRTIREIQSKLKEWNTASHPGSWSRQTIIQFTPLA